MICAGKTAAGAPCSHKAKHFNVCGVHKKQASWINGNELDSFKDTFNTYINICRNLRDTFEGAEQRLSARGINALDIQRFYNYNLTQSPSSMPSDPDEYLLVVCLEQQRRLIEKYKLLLDPYLAWNVNHAVMHRLV